MVCVKVRKIDSLEDFDWSDSADVHALYKNSQQGCWNENLDFLIIADELVCLEKTKQHVEVELLSIKKSIESEQNQINERLQFENDKAPSEKNLRARFREKKIKIQQNRDELASLQIIQGLEAKGKEKEDSLKEIQEQIGKTQEKIFSYIADNTINVSGRVRNEWLEIYRSNPSSINLDCIKIFFPRIKALVDERLREFINSEYNKSQMIEMGRHVTPLNVEVINAYHAKDDAQQQKIDSFFYSPEPRKKSPEQQQEEEQKSCDY